MKKILPLLLTAIVLPGLASCNNNQKQKESKVEMIADFEQWGPDFQTIRITYGFGRIEQNEDKKFVKSGDYSALVRPLGDKTARFLPTFYFPLRSRTFDFNKGDLTKYSSMFCSVYNDNDFDMPVTVGFITEFETYYNVRKASGETFNLPANSWTEIEYKIDIDFLSMYFNVEEAPALYFEFEKQDVYDASFAPRLYFDDIYFTFADEIRKPIDTFILKENEICDFEEDFQKSFFSVTNVKKDHLSFDITEEVDGVKPTSGNKMLHIHSSASNVRWVNWSHFIISEVYMKQTAMAKLSIEEFEKQQWAFCYDVMVKNIESEQIVPSFYMVKNSNEAYIGGLRGYETGWTTHEIVFNKEYPVGPGNQPVTIDAGYILRIGQFHFSIPDEMQEYDIYIDNIRLEKREGI